VSALTASVEDFYRAKRSSWWSAAPPVEGTIHTHGSSRADGPGVEKMVYKIESAVVSRVKQILESSKECARRRSGPERGGGFNFLVAS
jgi:hypothetical protein